MQLTTLDLLNHHQLSSSQRALGAALRPWVEEQITPYAAQWDEAGEFPMQLRKQAASIGLLGLGFPEEVGGTACDMVGRIVATTELCRAGLGGLNASLMSHTIMVWPMIVAGNQSVCQPILKRIFAGEAVGALGVTEADGGSDVAQLKTRATAVEHGWSITGSKMYITSGMKADYILVAARTGAGGAGGISLFLVPGSTAGLERQLLHKAGWWCSDTAALYFDNCPVPHNHLVGELDHGFSLIMQNFNAERLLMAAASISFAVVCIEEAWAWAQQRKTFGRTLMEHQVIRQKIVGMIERVLPLQSWLIDIGARVDRAEACAGEIALLKNAAGKAMRDCADEAIQVLGASGYMRGSRSERIYREVKVMMIGGGANEILNDLAAKQLGLI
jgi:acyl-CoA dehydrogenase